MTLVDWVILVMVAMLALQGFSRGFVAGAMSLVGFVLGAIIGARVGPLLLSGGAHSPYAALFGLGGALIVGMVLGRLFEGLASRVRIFMIVPGLKLVDGLAGSVLTGCIGLGIAWILGAVLIQTSGQMHLPTQLRKDLGNSVILRFLNGVLPPSGPILNALARVDPLPIVTGPVANVAAPNPKIVNAAAIKAARPSIVRVVGQACGLGVEGSGWAATRDLIVTNAHVVAGEHDTAIQIDGTGRAFSARVVVFDVHDDVAILRVPGVRLRSLQLGSGSEEGTSAAILGYPQNGPYEARPGRLGATQMTATQNAYGSPAMRKIASLRGVVRPGNSGGPMVDGSGQVVATVFAQITNAPAGKPGGFAVPNSVVAKDLKTARHRTRAVSTQRCAA